MRKIELYIEDEEDDDYLIKYIAINGVMTYSKIFEDDEEFYEDSWLHLGTKQTTNKKRPTIIKSKNLTEDELVDILFLDSI